MSNYSGLLIFLCITYDFWYHQKGPHSRNPRLRDPNAEQCVAECWYFEYHLDISFDQKQNTWLSASGELIPGKYSIGTMIYIILVSWWYKDDKRTFPLMDGYNSIDEKLTDLVGSLFNSSFHASVFHSTGELCFDISPTRHSIFQCTEPKAILDFETLHRTKNSLASATNTILMSSCFVSKHALLR